MYRPDDNDIDRLSREAAEHYLAPGAPSWDAMRQSLDKEIPYQKEKKRRGFLFFFFLTVGLLVAGSGIWYGIHTNKTANTIADKPVHITGGKSAGAEKVVPGGTFAKDNTIATNKTVKPAPDATAATAKEIPVKNIPASKPVRNTVEPTTMHPTTLASAATRKSATRTNPVVNNNGLAQKDATANAGTLALSHNSADKRAHQHSITDGNIAIPGGENRYSTGRKLKKNNSATPAGEEGDEVAVDKTNTDTIKDNTSAISHNELPVTVLPDAASKTTGQQPIAPKDIAAEKPVVKTGKSDSVKAAAAVKTKSKNEKAILIGLTAGLDLSTVKFTYNSNMGYNIGLLGGYQFSKHWSAYTGIVYTKKIYKLNGYDYHPPKDYWTTYVNLETVAGYCRMWELPLLARYTFNPQSKTAFFASAGMSSYFMRKQQYSYSFKTNMMQNTVDWSDDSSFNHIFSILDLSAGFEKRMGKHMSWQVEPYARIPLGGIGFGNIRLSSFGVNLTIQYRQPVKR